MFTKEQVFRKWKSYIFLLPVTSYFHVCKLWVYDWRHIWWNV